ncbi:hypothetical protein ACGFIF_18995 [Kribbella sp. NPDC049174]|uniref:hypothetical protein n=1 Tax=Kribbella sp. NPDC049174 TaxID=3364112 RepID=UPI003710D859
MNLQDLRDELTARATTADDHPADLLPGVRRKVRRTKQRRLAAALGSIAAIVALAVTVVPSVIDTSTPDPAENVPADITKNGFTLSGVEGPDRLETGTIGDVGSSRLAIDWIPTTHDVGLYAFCQATSTTTHYWVRINGQTAASGACSTSVDTPDGHMLRSDDTLWLNTPSGQPAAFSIELVDERGKPVEDQAAQLALGIYRAGELQRPGPPVRIPPPAPGDYEKDGVRFRTRVGGDTLTAAQVADRGQGQLSLTFRANAGPVVLHSFCTADRFGYNSVYGVRISLNGVVRSTGTCSSSVTDAVQGSAMTWGDVAGAGEQVVVVATLVDQNGRPVSVPEAQIGLGVYQKGDQRPVADGVALDELTEYSGYTYRLADVRTVDAVAGKALELATPEGKPFLIAYGSSDIGSNATVELSGLSLQSNGDTGGGVATVGEAARGAGTASVAISKGKATKGKLVLALYLPAG